VSDQGHAKLLKAAAPDFKPFLHLRCPTGARPGKIAFITAENVDEANALVALRDPKTARP
jgi:hypothetical protein